MLCRNCGNEIPDGTWVCGVCGAPQQGAEQSPNFHCQGGTGQFPAAGQAAGSTPPQPLENGSEMPPFQGQAMPVQNPYPYQGEPQIPPQYPGQEYSPQPPYQYQGNAVQPPAPPVPPYGYGAPYRGQFQPPKPKKKLSKKAKIGIFSGAGVLLVAIVVAVVLIVMNNNPVNAYMNALHDGDIDRATQIYSEQIENDEGASSELEEKVLAEINSITQDFKDQKITEEEAADRLNVIYECGVMRSDALRASGDVKELQSSRDAFQSGSEYMEAKDYGNAINQFSLVIEEDANYQKAQENIESLKSSYKEQVLGEVEAAVGNKEFEEAAANLDEALQFLPNDDELLKKQEEVHTKQGEQYKREQKVTVKSAKFVEQDSTYKYLYPDMIQVIIHNGSGKTIKEMQVGLLAYDKNGYPLKREGLNSFDEVYEFVGYALDVNILDGQDFGSDKGWELKPYSGISQALACVKTVEFYDGTTWENPYYDFWIEEYKEQPLH